MTHTPKPRKCRTALTASALCLLAIFACRAQAQTIPVQTPAPAPSTTAPCAQTPACPQSAPRVIQLSAVYKNGDQPLQQDDKVLQLARKRFYLSPCPFNLEKIQSSAGPAPSRSSYYSRVHASPQLIRWLETNNCDTIYCRELTREEVTCAATAPGCVPEFVRAYGEALRRLKGNQELARRWVTNYAPLSAPELRIGFYTEKTRWLDKAVAAVEKEAGLKPGTIRTAMTDRRGIAYFYDLCPGTYYISSLAPVEVEDAGFVWETTAINVKATKPPEPDQLSITPVFLANVPSKKKRANFFVGKRVAGPLSSNSGREGRSVRHERASQ